MKFRSFVMACLGLVLVCPVIAGENKSEPVDPEILKSPQPKDIGVLLECIDGGGCNPRLTPESRALLAIGKPAAKPIAKRLLAGNDGWATELECALLLGYMGPDAKPAESMLKKYLEGRRHPLPAGYVRAALAAMDQNEVELSKLSKNEGVPGARKYAKTLLRRLRETKRNEQLPSEE